MCSRVGVFWSNDKRRTDTLMLIIMLSLSFLFRFFDPGPPPTTWMPPRPLPLLDIYLGSTATGTGLGTDCSNTKAYTFFNSSGNWGSLATQIGPGTVVTTCGTISVAQNGGPIYTFQGSGTAGNVVSLTFATGAKLTSPAFTEAIELNGEQYIQINGGSTCGETAWAT